MNQTEPIKPVTDTSRLTAQWPSLDPEISVGVMLLEAEMLKLEAEASYAQQATEPPVLRDLSPLGR